MHRDLKPQNLMVSRAGDQAYGMDFSLAKLRGRSQLMGDRGRILGTPAYMAPEQVLAQEERIGAWTDVYGLGATLFPLLSGQPPFQGEGIEEVLRRIQACPPAPLGAEVDAVLGKIVLRCLEKDPALRFPSATNLWPTGSMPTWCGASAPNRVPFRP